MHYTVIRNPLSEEPEREEFQKLATAVKRYVRQARRHPHEHIQLIVDGNLPGTPVEKIAERFGH